MTAASERRSRLSEGWYSALPRPPYSLHRNIPRRHWHGVEPADAWPPPWTHARDGHSPYRLSVATEPPWSPPQTDSASANGRKARPDREDGPFCSGGQAPVRQAPSDSRVRRPRRRRPASRPEPASSPEES